MGLLALLREKGDVVEADLRRFYQADLRDVWREDEHGRPKLTLRQVLVYVQHLPRDSSLAIDDNGGMMPWSMAEHLAADTWLLLAAVNSKKGKAPKDHPARAKQGRKNLAKKVASKAHLFAAAKAREAKRRAGFDRTGGSVSS